MVSEGDSRATYAENPAVSRGRLHDEPPSGLHCCGVARSSPSSPPHAPRIEAEAIKRGGRPFSKLSDAQQMAICDDICQPGVARMEFKTAAHFFNTYRNLTAGGYYTTPQGAKDIGYVGNGAYTKDSGLYDY